jgi:hypothetical protein
MKRLKICTVKAHKNCQPIPGLDNGRLRVSLLIIFNSPAEGDSAKNHRRRGKNAEKDKAFRVIPRFLW